MAEENKTEEKAEISKPVTLDDIDSRLRQLDEKTATLKAENDRTEKMLMNSRLAGISGKPNVEQPKEETAKEYAQRVMSGKYDRK